MATTTTGIWAWTVRALCTKCWALRACNEREQPVFGISSYADERPSSKDNDTQNRRVELRFVLAFQPTETGATKGPSSTLKKMQETVR